MVAVVIIVGVTVCLINGVIALWSVGGWTGAAYELMLSKRKERKSSIRQSAPVRDLMRMVRLMSLCILHWYFPGNYSMFTLLVRW